MFDFIKVFWVFFLFFFSFFFSHDDAAVVILVISVLVDLATAMVALVTISAL